MPVPYRGYRAPWFAVGSGNGCVAAADWAEHTLGWRRDMRGRPTPTELAAAGVEAAKGDREAVAGRRRRRLAMLYVEYPTAAEMEAVRNGSLKWLGRGCLYNHVRGVHALTDKSRMLETLRGTSSGTHDFLPATWDLRDGAALREFAAQVECAGEGAVFLLKRPRGSKGSGVFLVRPGAALRGWLSAAAPHDADEEEEKKHGDADGGARDDDPPFAGEPPSAYVAQSYVSPPLLLHDRCCAAGHKFDLRCYLLVARAASGRNGLLWYYRDGYARLSLSPFFAPAAEGGPVALDRFVHLTNLSVQKRHPEYERRREDAVRSWSDVCAHVERAGGDGAAAALRQRVLSIARHVAAAAAPHIARGGPSPRAADASSGGCCFELLGIDLLVDEQMRPWLLEVNRNPDMERHNATLAKLLPDVLGDALELVKALHDRFDEAETNAAPAPAVAEATQAGESGVDSSSGAPRHRSGAAEPGPRAGTAPPSGAWPRAPEVWPTNRELVDGRGGRAAYELVWASPD